MSNTFEKHNFANKIMWDVNMKDFIEYCPAGAPMQRQRGHHDPVN